LRTTQPGCPLQVPRGMTQSEAYLGCRFMKPFEQPGITLSNRVTSGSLDSSGNSGPDRSAR
jgi:hypothetical protein